MKGDTDGYLWGGMSRRACKTGDATGAIFIKYKSLTAGFSGRIFCLKEKGYMNYGSDRDASL